MTSDLANLNIRDDQSTTNHVFIGDGSGLPILTSSSSTLHTPYRPLHMNNILCALKIFKNLLSIFKFVHDNTYFF